MLEKYYEREIQIKLWKTKGESGTKERESSVYYYINYSYTTLLNIRTIYLYYIYIILLKINKINFLHIKGCRLLQYHLHDLLILI